MVPACPGYDRTHHAACGTNISRNEDTHVVVFSRGFPIRHRI